jgi:membrane-associated HD superfamily phosphohydrolase
MQLLIGLILYFISPKVTFFEGWMKDSMTRFFALEHILLMIVAIAIITIGRRRAEKKLEGTRNKHRAILISYVIGLILILVSIPWPFGRWASFGAGWG